MHYLMQFFEYKHLPDHLKEVSSQFGDLAGDIDATLPDNPEKTTALRKLLEAKDCAVRAVIFKQQSETNLNKRNDNMSAIYLVKTPSEERLIQAGSKSVAINHAVKSAVEAKAITALELVEFMKKGLVVEIANKKHSFNEAEPVDCEAIQE